MLLARAGSGGYRFWYHRPAKATLQVYFADGSLFGQVRNNTTTSLMLASLDSDGNGYVFSALRWRTSAPSR